MNRMNAATKLCAVIGHPISHSLSPVIHNAAYQALDVNMVYVAFDVPPEALPAALEGVRALGVRGLSVTIPHKEALLGLVDEATPTVRAIGAANTVVNDAGRLTAHTTDGIGGYRALATQLGDGRTYSFSGKTVLFLGAGGAARSLAFCFAMEHAPPARLLIANRTTARAEALARDIATATGVEAAGVAHDAETLAVLISGVDLVVNCSPLGMSPRVDETPLPREILERRAGLEVFDTVYNPLETRLLREAREAGARTAGGLAMLLHQAAAQVELFTGRPAPLEAMERAALAFWREREV